MSLQVAEAGGLLRLWKFVREALAGSHRDFTVAPLNTSLILLAIPMVLEMVMESLFGIVDVFFVARLGHEAVAIVGLTESLLALVFGVALGLSLATTAMVARRIGEKDEEGAAVAAAQAMWIGLVVSALVGIIGITMAPRLLLWMGGDATVIRSGAPYTATLLGGSVVIFFLFLINAIFRGAGDAALAMRTLWLANTINIVLDPCLINGWGPFPHLGVMGAAVATTTGRGVGVLFQLWLLLGGKSRVRLRFGQLRLQADILVRLLRVSVTGMIQFLVATASWMLLVRIISTFGSTAVAGYTIAVRMFIFVILPCWGMCNAAATLVGQNLGAQRPDRSEAAVYRAGVLNMIYLGLVSVVYLCFAEQLAEFFTKEPDVVRVAARCLRTFSRRKYLLCLGHGDGAGI